MPGYLFFKHISDYPSDRETGWSEELQGVTHDDDNWFITQKNRLWKIKVGVDLNGTINKEEPARGIFTAPIPAALKKYNHFGDLDYYDGSLFIALEGESQTPRIACFDTNLGYFDSALLPEQSHAPWCAVNPADGLLYSSEFDNVRVLNAYSFTFESNRLRLKLHHKLRFNDRGKGMKISGVQGGVFANENGENNLFLSSNADAQRGVHVFRWPDGSRIQTISIPSDFWTVGEEIEGLTYWDLNSGRAPGIRGQLHVLELDNDTLNDDDVKGFKHYEAIRFPFIANRNRSCLEVHRSDCKWIHLMAIRNKVGYNSLRKAIKDGYDGCHYCIGGKLDKR